MKKNLPALVLLLPALALFSGCASDHGAYAPRNTMVNNLEDSSSFVLFDEPTQHSVTCDGLEPQRLPDGRLQVAANVRNRENRRIQVQVNCEFKDAQGFVLDSSPFQNLFLDENAQQGVTFVSMNDQAVRYTIRVRQAR
ncbi:MAG: YcfL family protein [Verrucomicrobiota bacterium]|jgi:hypothetical protein